MTDLEQAQALLESHGWKVERPPFDDPYEVMYRRMMAGAAGPGKVHPTDDPMNPAYEWTDWDTEALRFLKAHFALKMETIRWPMAEAPEISDG